jgi:hypothetical protein
MNKKEREEEQQSRFLIHFEECGQQRIVDASTLMNPYAIDPTMHRSNYNLWMHCFHEKRGRCEISFYHKAAVPLIPLSQPKRRRQHQEEEEEYNHDDR